MLSRRNFLKLGGDGLAGVALFSASGCGGESQGSEKLVFSMRPDSIGSFQNLVKKFNDQNKGQIKVNYREMPADTGQYFDQLRTEFQAGGGDIEALWKSRILR